MDETSLQIARRLHPEDFQDDPLYSPDDLYILPDSVMWFALVLLCAAAAAAVWVLL